MKKIIVDGKERIMVKYNEPCVICGKPLSQVVFSWNMFHGEATASCCDATYQIKDYYIEKPNKEQKILLEMLRGDYYELNIKNEWIEPLKKAMKELNATKITEQVIDLAETFL